MAYAAYRFFIVFFSEIALCSNASICVQPSNVIPKSPPCPDDAVNVSSFDQAMERAKTLFAPADIVLLPGLHNVTSLAINSSTVRQIRGLDMWASADRALKRPRLLIQAQAPSTSSSGIYLYNVSDMTWSNLDVMAEGPSSMIKLIKCRNITFIDVSFNETAAVFSPLLIHNSFHINFVGCTFLGYGNPLLNTIVWTAMNISFDQMNETKLHSGAHIPTVSIVDGSFTQMFDVVFPTVQEIVITPLLEQEQVVLGIHFTGEETQGLTVFIERCSFQNIQMPLGSPFRVHFSHGSSNNQVLLHRASFSRISAKVGAAMLAVFQNDCSNNSIEIANSTFDQLFASEQGGAVAALFLSANNNFISFTNCSFMKLSTDVTLGVGAALSLFSTTPLDTQRYTSAYQITIKDSRFDNNSSPYGVIFARSVAIKLEGNCIFQFNVHGPIILYNSLLHFGGHQSFTNNSALSGGAVSLYDQSNTVLTETKKLIFLENEAILSGGAVYVDSSNGLAFVEWINRRIGVQVESNCLFYYPSNSPQFNIDQFDRGIEFATPTETLHSYTVVLFRGNAAGRNGADISTPSMTNCISLFDSCELLESISHHQYVPIAADSLLSHALKVVNVQTASRSLSKCASTNSTLFANAVPSQVATGVNWLFFEQASCSCLKPVLTEESNQYWYFDQACDATKIIDIVTEWLRTKNSTVFRRVHDPFALNYRFPIPPEGMFYVPWSHSWVYHLFTQAGDKNITNVILLPANITLTPAPGEVFQLRIRGYDQFLRSVNASVAYLSLHPPYEGLANANSYEPPYALLRRGSKQYAYRDSVIFRLNDQIADLSLVGVVNATGTLWVAADSVFPDSQTVLNISFRLSACHLGFTNLPSSEREKAIERILTATTRTATVDDEMLRCQCLKTSNAVSSCTTTGKTVVIQKGKWAGDVKYKHGRYSNGEPRKGTLEEVLSPVFNKQFGWGSCVLHYCSDTVIDSRWTLGSDDPCQKGKTGPLCGHCLPNLSVTSFDLHCSDCSSSSGVDIGILATAFVIIFGGIVILAVGMLTDIATSTTFDSLLFIFQVTPYFAPVGTQLAATMIHFQRMYIPHFCVSQAFHSLSYLAFQFAFPSFLLTMVITLALFSRCRPVDRLLTLPRALKAVVFVLLITYANFTYASMNLLEANRLYTTNDPDGQLVLFTNGSVPYADSSHVPLLPPAAFLLIVVTVFPVLAVYFMDHPRVRPLSDIYTCYYNDKYRWWIGINLFRRYLIAAIANFMTVTTTQNIRFIRQKALTATIFLLTVLQLMCNPLRSKFANVFETTLLVNLCFFSGLNLAQSVTNHGTTRFLYAVAFWPYGAGAVIFVYWHRHQIADVWLKCHRRLTSTKFNNELQQQLLDKETDSGNGQL